MSNRVNGRVFLFCSSRIFSLEQMHCNQKLQVIAFDKGLDLYPTARTDLCMLFWNYMVLFKNFKHQRKFRNNTRAPITSIADFNLERISINWEPSGERSLMRIVKWIFLHRYCLMWCFPAFSVFYLEKSCELQMVKVLILNKALCSWL